MKVVVSILTVLFGLLLIDQTTSAQILDFKAEHIGDSKDVSIRFYISKPIENVSLEFSISLDGGKTYQSTVTTFQSENHPSNGVRQGENLFIWRAGIDIPDTYVDPSFLKMAISMTTRSDLQLEFLTDTKTPTIKITAPTPVFEVVQFIAGKVYGKAYSSLTDMVRPGTYSKSTITELLRSFDPNVWSPPGAKDTEINIAATQPPINAYSQLENTLGVNFDPRSYFGTGDEKFGAREFTYDGNRDAQISPVGRKPIDIDASVIEKPSNGNDLIEAESPVPGRSIAFNFLAFRDNVTLANVMTMDHGLQLNISRLLPKLPEDPMSEEKLNELNPDYEWFPTQDWRPRDSWLEPGGANFDEIFGLVWNRGDWIVGFFNANGIYDIGYIPNPEVKIAHDEKGNHKIFENEVVSLGSESQMGDSFTGVKIWKVEISNRDMPLLALERFEKDFGQFLNLRKSFPASQLLKNSRPLNSQTEAEIVADNATDDLIRNYEESKGNNDTQPGNLEGERPPSPNQIIDDIDSTLPGFEGFTDFSQIPGSLVEENLDNLFEQAIDRLRSQEATVSEDEVNEVIQMRNKIEARSRFKPANPSTSPTTYYKIWDSGSANARYNIMVTGDGYANNETDRAEIWSFINEKILDGFCKADIQPSYLNAVNIYYLDAKSAQSGITQSAVTLIPKTSIFATLDALLDPLYLYSESNRLDSSQWRFYHAVGSKRSTAWHFAATDWEACWRVPLPGANTWSSLDAYARAVLGSQCDEIWVVQKDGQGACATTKNGRRVVTIADTRSASTLLHEWGHSFARLGDEYIASGSGSTVFSGSDSDRNILAASSWDESTRASLPGHWKKYVPGWRPLPTIESDVGTEDQDVGAFEGAKYVGKGVYRPVFDGRNG